MQIEVWAIFVRLEMKMLENYFGIQMFSYFKLFRVTCYTRHADFDELFRILKLRIFLRHFQSVLRVRSREMIVNGAPSEPTPEKRRSGDWLVLIWAGLQSATSKF